jgi:phage FluMu protein Com
MSELKERIAYLKGLSEGLSLDKESKEGKLFNALIEVLEESTIAIDEIANNQIELEKYIEAVDEDLGEIEDDIYGEDEDDDEYDDNCECCDDDCDCNYIELECPKCHDIIRYESSILEDDDVLEVTCPNCDEVIYINEDTLEMEKDKDN